MNFFSDFRQSLTETINKGDVVQVIGRDEFKGWFGTVTKVKEISGERVFTVELEADGKRIERFRDALRKEYIRVTDE